VVARPTARRAVGAGLVVAVVAVVVVLRHDAVLSTLRSPAALVRVGAIVLALVLLSAALRRLVPRPWMRAVVMAVPLGALVWFVAVPYATDRTVVESLPAAAPPASTTTVAPPPGAATPPPDTSAPAAPVPSAPVRLQQGPLTGIGHRASGTAALFRLEDGTSLVRLEDIDVENGPDYRVHLVPGRGRQSPGGGVDLGALKGNKGSHNYAVPADVDLAAGDVTVLIWCRVFSVPVAAATQEPL
jgi:hypothetical protein